MRRGLVPAIIALSSVQAHQQPTLQALHTFSYDPGTIAVVQGSDGNLYGTTELGGRTSRTAPSGGGTVFKLATSGAFSVLYRFSNASDGVGPNTLVQGSDGNLYGTTTFGGSRNRTHTGVGVVFTVTPSGKFKTLHTFHGPDGYLPSALLQSGDGNLYGATELGGPNYDAGWPSASGIHYHGHTYGTNTGSGTVFRITKSGALAMLHAFNGDDGQGPNALTEGNDGNFYGTTSGGGDSGQGSVFGLAPSGEPFASEYSFSGPDGQSPNVLILGSDHNLYGTTRGGGSPDTGAGEGTVFTLNSSGFGTLSVFNFLGSDGMSPNTLIQGSDKNLYGTTSAGGGSLAGYGQTGSGTVFEIDTNGVSSTLYVFSGDEGSPSALIQGSDGNLYGATANTQNKLGKIFRVGYELPSLTTTPPEITEGPETQSVAAGAEVTFTVTASGATPLSYEWFRNGKPIRDTASVGGAKTATLTLQNVTREDAGSYEVQVSNAFGANTSSSATLTVTTHRK